MQIKRLIIFILIFGLFGRFILGQNLVNNGSFEEFVKCPRSYTEKGEVFELPSWYSPSKSTPDYFNSCNNLDVGVPRNIMGYQLARDGNAYVGLMLLQNPESAQGNKNFVDYREYIQTKLRFPLEQDRAYIIRFYYSVAPYSKFALNGLGACISQNAITAKYEVIKSENILTTIELVPQSDTIAGHWNLFCDTIVAKGGEFFLTIGNFKAYNQESYWLLDISKLSRFQQSSAKANAYSYYYIDKVSLEPYIKPDEKLFKSDWLH
jgi:OmpA-OmpF porin, OOP family